MGWGPLSNGPWLSASQENQINLQKKNEVNISRKLTAGGILRGLGGRE